MAQSNYRKALVQKTLSEATLNTLLDAMRTYLKVEPFSEQHLGTDWSNYKVPAPLKHLSIHVATGHRSWDGLVIGFPGTKNELSTGNVGTPFLREILYPALDLHRNLQQAQSKRMPCIYLLGERFSDVFLRKFRMLDAITPHVILLTGDLYRSLIRGKIKNPSDQPKMNESWLQSYLCGQMESGCADELPLLDGVARMRYVSHEVATSEGTKNPERLDILCADKESHSLVAFEIKGPDCGKVQLENLFLQGLEHKNWVEANKMAIKFLVEGPKGKHINTKKRVRLILGFCSEDIPMLFHTLRKQASTKDRHLKIDFLRFAPPDNVNGKLNFQGELTAARKVILMLAELHKRGYERLRLLPGMAPNGIHWRYAITPIAHVSREHGARSGASCGYDDFPRGSLSASDQMVGWGDNPTSSPKELADLFVRTYPAICRDGKGKDSEYVAWYKSMLMRTHPDGIVWAYSDSYNDNPPPIEGLGAGEHVNIPMPPPGEDKPEKSLF